MGDIGSVSRNSSEGKKKLSQSPGGGGHITQRESLRTAGGVQTITDKKMHQFSSLFPRGGTLLRPRQFLSAREKNPFGENFQENIRTSRKS